MSFESDLAQRVCDGIDRVLGEIQYRRVVGLPVDDLPGAGVHPDDVAVAEEHAAGPGICQADRLAGDLDQH